MKRPSRYIGTKKNENKINFGISFMGVLSLQNLKNRENRENKIGKANLAGSNITWIQPLGEESVFSEFHNSYCDGAMSPCSGPNADITFYAQSTFILPIQGKSNSYIAMFDMWNRTNLQDSRYVWLPKEFIEGKMVIKWKNQWQIR